MPEGFRIILAAQALRGFGYGFGAVLLGVVLESRGWSGTRAGVLLTAIVAGSALTSFLIGRFGDQLGKRNSYALLFFGMSLAGTAFALSDSFWLLLLVSLLGTLSTDVVESGPFTSLEQAMIPALVEQQKRPSAFGTYNAVATVAGSFGALAAGGPALLREVVPAAPADARFFGLFILAGIVGVLLALRLPRGVESDRRGPAKARSLERSRPEVLKLSSLFAWDSLAGGFVVQAFIAFWFRREYGLSQEVLGATFFAVGFLQAGSFLLATRIARRIGLLNTMVFTHLPSNLLLAAIPLSPNAGAAVALLLARFALSQMDVPTRQAYVVSLVGPEERTAAAAYTNSARMAVRPLGPVLAGISQQLGPGAPFLLAGGLKALYDLALWAMFRRVRLPADAGSPGSERASGSRKGNLK